jgi:hypothetical protein
MFAGTIKYYNVGKFYFSHIKADYHIKHYFNMLLAHKIELRPTEAQKEYLLLSFCVDDVNNVCFSTNDLRSLYNEPIYLIS